MHPVPDVPAVADHPSILDGGHLWLIEAIDGLPMRFRVEASGLCVFGDTDREFDDVPPAFAAAARHVRTHLDRDALRRAAADLPGITFVGVATVRRAVDYDWGRPPPFVGTEVHSRHRGGFLPPDAVEQAYDGIDLTPSNALRKEVRAADFHPDAFTFPDSAWYGGPVAGVRLRNKTGDRAELTNPAVQPPATPVAVERDPAELGRAWTTPERIQAVRDRLAAQGTPADPDTVRDRVLETIHREEYWTIAHADREIATESFRSAVGERVRALLTADG